MNGSPTSNFFADRSAARSGLILAPTSDTVITLIVLVSLPCQIAVETESFENESKHASAITLGDCWPADASDTEIARQTGSQALRVNPNTLLRHDVFERSSAVPAGNSRSGRSCYDDRTLDYVVGRIADADTIRQRFIVDALRIRFVSTSSQKSDRLEGNRPTDGIASTESEFEHAVAPRRFERSSAVSAESSRSGRSCYDDKMIEYVAGRSADADPIRRRFIVDALRTRFVSTGPQEPDRLEGNCPTDRTAGRASEAEHAVASRRFNRSSAVSAESSRSGRSCYDDKMIEYVAGRSADADPIRRRFIVDALRTRFVSTGPQEPDRLEGNCPTDRTAGRASEAEHAVASRRFNRSSAVPAEDSRSGRSCYDDEMIEYVGRQKIGFCWNPEAAHDG